MTIALALSLSLLVHGLVIVLEQAQPQLQRLVAAH